MPKKPRQSARMQRFSTLAGAYRTLPKNDRYKVVFETLIGREPLSYQFGVRMLVIFGFTLVLLFAAILFWPAHWVVIQEPTSPVHTQNMIMLGILMALQLLVIIGAFSSTRSTIKARDPLPVRPPKGLKVAFITTRAPGEPVSMVQTTLVAAKNIQYNQGRVDVWLLDETDDPELRKLCRKLKVNHFSRKGVERWNTPKPLTPKRKLANWIMGIKTEKPDPFHAARTKHGNINAWLQHLQKKKRNYDIIAGVDTDQVPEPNFLMRMLGYFRDSDVAFVVGPQVYGNYKPGLASLVARWAESQASFFQSTIQRAGNASGSPMFVGTNYTVRMNVLRQIGGMQPCITEDMATGIAIHAARNPKTGKHWRSVYTPDVLAVGEGPDTWGPYFTQQWRWAAGAFDTWRHTFWKIILYSRPATILHYLLIMTYYPIAALTWLFAIISSLIYLTTGATAVIAPWNEFVALYLMSAIMQLSLYFWNRRYNVSPHEPEGSYGMGGIAISSLTAPIYFSALIGILSGKKPNFVVTQKGGGAALDGLGSFRSHLRWAVLLIGALGYGIYYDHMHPAMLIWAVCLLAVCFTPVTIAVTLAARARIPRFVARVRASPIIIQKETTNA